MRKRTVAAKPITAFNWRHQASLIISSYNNNLYDSTWCLISCIDDDDDDDDGIVLKVVLTLALRVRVIG